jgi:subtilisin family serine protease
VLRVAAVLGATLLALPLAAQETVNAKLSVELRVALGGGGPALPWLKPIVGDDLVKVIVSSSADEALLPRLINGIVSLGGSVHYNYPALNAVAALMPLSKLTTLAAHGDVASISPNRPVMRSQSLLQRASGAAELPGGSLLNPGLDGSGIGIAVLDSGVDWNHQHMSAPSLLSTKGPSRVRQVVDFVALSRSLAGGGWLQGSDQTSLSINVLNGLSFNLRLQTLQLPVSTKADPYGHGSHVAAIAAGRGDYQLPDTTGIAPNADVYDIRVLDDEGLGTTADVLAGIDWVIQHARLLNIRVMNLSLAADSTKSFLTDPLARAARAASNLGIVVVVSAGNFGQGADGRLNYGVIGSPGHDP